MRRKKMKVTDIKKEMFLPYTYTAMAMVTDEMMVDVNFNLQEFVTHKMALDIANKIVKTVTIYSEEDKAAGITTFMARPVLMDSRKFNELLDEYILKVVESIGSENKENTSRRNTRPVGPFPYKWFESDSNKD
jgi:hypothetical protein